MKRLGEILIEKGLLEAEELDKALAVQSLRGEKLGKILSDLGFTAAREVLAALSDGNPVAAREGNLVATTFHPELTEDVRFHEYFLTMVDGKFRAKT